MVIKICPKCNILHCKPGTHCSRKCANSRVWTEADKIKKSLANKGNAPKHKGRDSRIKQNCLSCGNSFKHYPSLNRKYCSKECAATRKQSGGKGGYREGSGKSKTGYYKGIYCGSTYELVWVIFRLDHNLPVKRFMGHLTNGKLKYYPDFIIDNKIVEIKGWKRDDVEAKMSLATSNGYQIIVLYKQDLKTEFEWVKLKYSFKSLEELYDGYKPSYEYVCGFCKNVFFKNKKSKHLVNFCCRSCSGKHRAQTKNRDAAGVATSPSN